MKNKRHQKILEIIKEQQIDTQESLAAALAEAGFPVTQATVSRDIKKLNLMKKLNADGRYQYVSPAAYASPHSSNKFWSMFHENVIASDRAMNTVVIKCHTGMANAVCAAMDAMDWEHIVGTLAGDDTIFVLFRSEQQAAEWLETVSSHK